MDQPHGADATLPNILEDEPDIGLLQGKVSIVGIEPLSTVITDN